MKLCLTFAGVLISLGICAQANFKAVDRESIKKLVTDSSLETYYPKLVARLKNYDTTMSVDEFRLLYYGFVFQDSYSGIMDEKTGEIKKALDKKRYKEAIKLCDDVIDDIPASLQSYYFKMIALSKLDSMNTDFAKTRFEYTNFIGAIITSGDGLDCTTAFKVISVSDEYEVMYRYFEVGKVLMQSYQSPCDKIIISGSKYFAKSKIYFDVSESFLAMDKMFQNKN